MTQSRPYERLGGAQAVRAVVAPFYEKLLVSPRLARYFENVDIHRLVEHQTAFVASVLGGPQAVSDEKLKEAHAGLGIDEGDFEQMLLLLRESLEESGLEPADVGLILSEMRTRSPLVIENP